MSSSGSLRIKRIKFVAGPRIGSPPLDLPDLGQALILVGPNNSGKSLTLREIENWCFGEETVRKIVEDLEVDFPRELNLARGYLERLKTAPPPGQGEAQGAFWVAHHSFKTNQPIQVQVNDSQIEQAINYPNSSSLRQLLTSRYTIRLDGRTRFSLVSDRPAGDLLRAPQNHLWALFVNDEGREKVRKLVEEAFELFFVIDPTAMQTFRIRLSERAPEDIREEQGLDQRSRKFHSTATHIGEFSDGVQAFVGLVSAILSLEHRIQLIDEPEAFLFPPLARRLGANLGEITALRQATLIVATHSAEFLMGCLEKINASVVRLTYNRKTRLATARNLPSSELRSMVTDPLLRSSRVIDALFHEAVVVTEGDSDRAFYDEVNRRLQVESRGIRDALFVNAQNKQTEHKIIGPLRRIGVPAAAILDLDFLENGGANWERLIQASLVPQGKRSYFEHERSEIMREFEGLSKTPNGKPIKRSGISALADEPRSRAEALLTELAEYGIFLVPGGELEGWLKGLGFGGERSNWLVELFSNFGSDETSSTYVRPTSDDVWQFVDNIAAWTGDVNRKGT